MPFGRPHNWIPLKTADAVMSLRDLWAWWWESAGPETCGSGPSGLSTGKAGSYSDAVWFAAADVQLWHPCYTGCHRKGKVGCYQWGSFASSPQILWANHNFLNLFSSLELALLSRGLFLTFRVNAEKCFDDRLLWNNNINCPCSADIKPEETMR